MMTGDQVGQLLALIALGDNRKPPEDAEGKRVMIDFWMGTVGDLDFADAARAVQEHYQESTDWIKPAHIRRRVRAMRSDRLARSLVPAPPPESAESPGHYKQDIRDAIKRLADGFALPPAIGAPLPGDPPAAWTEARKALAPPQPERDPREVALAQAEASRQARERHEATERQGQPS